MERRSFVISLAVMLCDSIAPAVAQQSARLPVVGFLTSGGADSFAQFVSAMRDLGYIEGKNIVVERRSSAGELAPLKKLATELVQLKVDVLYATGPAAVSAARNATTAIPIVAFDLETDPVASGLVRTLSRPGGNLTGLFLDLPGLAGKWVELLHQAVPDRKSLNIVWDSTTGSAQLNAARSAADRLRIDIQVFEIRNSADLDRALSTAAATPTHPLVFLSSPLVSAKSKQISELTRRHSLPAISPFRAFADSGGLMSYGPNLLAFRRFAAAYVDKILKGTQPADLPIQQPDTFEFVINLQTAAKFGLAIPQSLLVSATDLVK